MHKESSLKNVKKEHDHDPNFSSGLDMLLHFSSNSSNQSDQSLPTKIAKLEARMVGKAPSAAPAPAQATWPAALCVAKYGVAATAENLSESLPSSDSDDD
ncbi:unnamed protein product [Camellia sinensis]